MIERRKGMANGEAGALFYLFIYLVSLLVILVYPYIALSNFTERKNVFLFYLCNIILFIFILIASGEVSNDSTVGMILRLLRVSYLLLPFLYYRFIEQYKKNQSYFMTYIGMSVIHFILYFNFLIN